MYYNTFLVPDTPLRTVLRVHAGYESNILTKYLDLYCNICTFNAYYHSFFFIVVAIVTAIAIVFTVIIAIIAIIVIAIVVVFVVSVINLYIVLNSRRTRWIVELLLLKGHMLSFFLSRYLVTTITSKRAEY